MLGEYGTKFLTNVEWFQQSPVSVWYLVFPGIMTDNLPALEGTTSSEKCSHHGGVFVRVSPNRLSKVSGYINAEDKDDGKLENVSHSDMDQVKHDNNNENIRRSMETGNDSQTMHEYIPIADEDRHVAELEMA